MAFEISGDRGAHETHRRGHGRVIAAALAVIIGAGIATGLSGCSIFGGIVNQQLSTQGNLANQRKFALEFTSKYHHPGLQSIQYVTDGYVDGGGSWGASVIVTVDGKEYEGFLGDLTGGGPLPKAIPGSASAGVAVTYSDGTSEVLK